MNGINKITARIAADAEAENRTLREETEKRCSLIRAEYETKAQEEYDKIIQEGVRENERRAASIERTARLESRKSILSMKQEVVSRAFDRAKILLCSLPEQDYISFLAKQASEASITGEEEIILNTEDRTRYGAKIVKASNDLLKKRRGVHPGLSLSTDVRDMSGGLILKQGDIEVNCSIDILLELNRERLSAEVAEILFES